MKDLEKASCTKQLSYKLDVCAKLSDLGAQQDCKMKAHNDSEHCHQTAASQYQSRKQDCYDDKEPEPDDWKSYNCAKEANKEVKANKKKCIDNAKASIKACQEKFTHGTPECDKCYEETADTLNQCNEDADNDYEKALQKCIPINIPGT